MANIIIKNQNGQTYEIKPGSVFITKFGIKAEVVEISELICKIKKPDGKIETWSTLDLTIPGNKYLPAEYDFYITNNSTDLLSKKIIETQKKFDEEFSMAKTMEERGIIHKKYLGGGLNGIIQIARDIDETCVKMDCHIKGQRTE